MTSTTRENFPKGMEALVDKAAAAYERDIWKSIKSTKRLEKAKEDLAIYDLPSERYPKNVKAFTGPADQVELDLPWSEVALNEKVISIKITKGKTRREA
ncbi:MAG: hypothetical protein ACKPKO_04095, partial [Candidatus Fonsibacter sp.]